MLKYYELARVGVNVQYTHITLRVPVANSCQLKGKPTQDMDGGMDLTEETRGDVPRDGQKSGHQHHIETF